MGNSLIEKLLYARINNILTVSDYMKLDILERHMASESKEDILQLKNPFPYQEDYSFGWKEIIEQAILNKVSCGFIFSGPDGCGKHTASELAYYILCANETSDESDEYYPFLFLPSRELIFSSLEQKADEEERYRSIEHNNPDTYTTDIIHRFFEFLFQQMPKDRGICLVIDNTDQLDMKAVYECLGQYLCISQVHKMQEIPSSEPYYIPPLFVIVIDKDIERIPSMLSRKLLLIRMFPPNLSQRKTLLQNMGIFDELIPSIAQATEHYTYTQLRSLAKNTQIYSSYEKNPDGTFYETLTRSQAPTETNSMTEKPNLIQHLSSMPEENHLLAEAKIRLYQKLALFIEKLPERLENMGPLLAVPQDRTAANTANTTENQPLSLFQINKDTEDILRQGPQDEAAITEECGNMKMLTLFSNVMKKERMEQLKLV